MLNLLNTFLCQLTQHFLRHPSPLLFLLLSNHRPFQALLWLAPAFFHLYKIMVQQLMDMLESKERKIINLRYFKNKTQSQVAKEMGMTQVQVSRLEKKILNSMRNEKST